MSSYKGRLRFLYELLDLGVYSARPIIFHGAHVLRLHFHLVHLGHQLASVSCRLSLLRLLADVVDLWHWYWLLSIALLLLIHEWLLNGTAANQRHFSPVNQLTVIERRIVLFVFRRQAFVRALYQRWIL